MKQQSWKDKKDEICKLIKQLSDYYGGDEVEWLREYAKEVIEDYKHDLDTALSCFKNLWSQCKMTK